MLWVHLVTRAALLTAALFAWRLRRLAPHYRPVARVLAAGWALDLLHTVLRAWIADQHRPFTGLARAVFHADQGAVLAFPALSAALALLVLAGWSPAIVWSNVAGAWVVALVVAIVRYPDLRGDDWIAYVGTAHGLAVATEIAALLTFARAGYAFIMAARREAPPGARIPLSGIVVPLQARACLVLLAGDLAQLLGPWLGAPVEHWAIWQVQSAVTLATLAVLEAKWIRSLSPI